LIFEKALKVCVLFRRAVPFRDAIEVIYPAPYLIGVHETEGKTCTE
jgi:hypothetical protein